MRNGSELTKTKDTGTTTSLGPEEGPVGEKVPGRGRKPEGVTDYGSIVGSLGSSEPGGSRYSVGGGPRCRGRRRTRTDTEALASRRPCRSTKW